MEATIRRAGLLVPQLLETGNKLGDGSYEEVVEVSVGGKLFAGKRLHAFFYRRDVAAVKKSMKSFLWAGYCLYKCIVLLIQVYLLYLHARSSLLSFLPPSCVECPTCYMNYYELHKGGCMHFVP